MVPHSKLAGISGREEPRFPTHHRIFIILIPRLDYSSGISVGI